MRLSFRLALATLAACSFSTPAFGSGWVYCVVGVHAPGGQPKMVLLSPIFESGIASDYERQWRDHIVPVVHNSARQSGQPLGKVDPQCQAVNDDYADAKKGYEWFHNRMKSAGLLTHVAQWHPQGANAPVKQANDPSSAASRPQRSDASRDTAASAAKGNGSTKPSSGGLVITEAKKPTPPKDDRSSPSSGLIRPHGTHLKGSAPIGPQPAMCFSSSYTKNSAGPTHDGASAEASVKAKPTQCSAGQTFVGAGAPWCEQNPIGRMWTCYRSYRCDFKRPGCKPSGSGTASSQ